MENINILIVEDEVISAMMLKSMLKKAGYRRLYHVTTGEKAIEQANASEPDITIMDIRLAGKLDGIETARVIKESTSSKIIFTTGYEDSYIKEKAQELNPLSYMIKPVNIKQLESLMAETHKSDC